MPRHLTSFAIVSLIAGLAACGNVDESSDYRAWDFEPEESAGVSGESGEPGSSTVEPRRPKSESPIAGCQADPIWWSNESTHRISGPHFEWTHEGLAILAGSDAFGSGSRAWSGRTGKTIFERSELSIIDSTADASRILTTRRQGEDFQVVVLDGQTRQPVWTLNAPEHYTGVTMSGDGERVGTIHCEYDPSGEPGDLLIEIHDILEDRVIHTETFDDHECSWWTGYGPQIIAFSEDGEHLAAALTTDPYTGRDEQGRGPMAILLSERDGAFERHEWELPLSQMERYNAQVATISFDPSGERLTFVSSSGETLEIDTEAGTIASRGQRGAFVSNHDTYLPLMPASPIDWTRSGDVEAFVDTDGAVVLRGSDGTRHARIFAPEESDIADWNPEVDIANPPVSVAFSPNDDMVAVAFRTGLGVWGCPGALDRVPGPEASELGVPEISATWTDDQYPSLVVNVTPTGRPAGFAAGQRLYVDGELVHSTELGATMRHYSETPSFTLHVEVDDGAKTVRSETITVRNPR